MAAATATARAAIAPRTTAPSCAARECARAFAAAPTNSAWLAKCASATITAFAHSDGHVHHGRQSP
jgi:hypothetical protein